MSTDNQLAAYVDRVLRMKEEADGIAEDIKAIYGEAKAEGYDKTQLGNLVTYLRKRAKDKDGEAEKEAVFELYLSAYLRAKGEVGTDRANARAHAPDDEITEPRAAPQPASDLTTSRALSGQVAPIQPEPMGALSEVALPTTDEDTSLSGQGSASGTGSAGGDGSIPSQASNLAPFTPKPIRPYCLNPGTSCGGIGKKHCWKCQKAHDEKQGAA